MAVITLANGEEYLCSALLSATDGDVAYVDLPEMTFAEAAAVFEDPEKTKTLLWEMRSLSGFTELIMMTKQAQGVEVTLRRHA